MESNTMSSLEADLKRQILGRYENKIKQNRIVSSSMLHYCRSKAEKVFRPWWDTLEDYLLNSLVLLGEPELSLFAINIFSIHIIPMIGRNRPR